MRTSAARNLAGCPINQRFLRLTPAALRWPGHSSTSKITSSLNKLPQRRHLVPSQFAFSRANLFNPLRVGNQSPADRDQIELAPIHPLDERVQPHASRFFSRK